MPNLKNYEFWFVTGSQFLYGDEPLRQVADHSKIIAEHLSEKSPFSVKFKPVVKTPEEIYQLCTAANSDEKCAGIITWMHTFSPAKMWIKGLMSLQKPLLHLHTQFNRDIPWDSIDMDFMNLNQSAHGDREFGFIGARLRMPRKVVAGYWKDQEVVDRLGRWMRSAVAFVYSKYLKVCRFGDNMRDVAVTEGDKVEAQIKLGWTIDGYGIGDLVKMVEAVSESDIDKLMEEYESLYDMSQVKGSEEKIKAVRYQARIEIALKAFMAKGNFEAFTTTFEDLNGLEQLPGLAAQRVMEAGYGFGGEGDWKTSAMVRLLKIMADGKATSFMEDYTYHFEPGNQMNLGAHMLEVCPTIASAKPRIEVHTLGIGGKSDPARLVFDCAAGPAICASLVDLGNRFRLIITVVDAVEATHDMPKLPVARVLMKPQPSLATAAEAWIHAGGAHHTVYSQNVTVEQLTDWADMCGIECIVIDNDTKINSLLKELRWNEIAFKLM